MHVSAIVLAKKYTDGTSSKLSTIQYTISIMSFIHTWGGLSSKLANLAAAVSGEILIFLQTSIEPGDKASDDNP